jgi:hypothetical protein
MVLPDQAGMGGGAGKPGVGVAGAKPMHSRGLTQDHRRGQHAAARDGQHRGGQAFNQVTKLAPQGVDLHGQLSAAMQQLACQPGNKASDGGQVLAEAVDDAVAAQPAGANPQCGVEFVQVPAQPVDHPGALTHQITAMIDQ